LLLLLLCLQGLMVHILLLLLLRCLVPWRLRQHASRAVGSALSAAAGAAVLAVTQPQPTWRTIIICYTAGSCSSMHAAAAAAATQPAHSVCTGCIVWPLPFI
jgi:hypothetical protein